ncbi:MAG: hypothetical protein M1839_007883 [Geoglossum umbratile]|nr:MAG: hypothetical protein M1839_007883 [Geoglossum umbratile]
MAAVAILSLFTLVGAVPRVTLPINAQVPPVARVSEPFDFSFSASTFSSEIQILNYTLSNAPAWLRLDGRSRIFSGTPTQGDVGPVTVQLTATDTSGSAMMDATLVVSANPSPQLGRPLSDQLKTFGPSLGSSTIQLYPASPFSFVFSKDTFVSRGGELTYYAVSSDHTPLPSWVSFDSSSLKFSGVTPPRISPTAPPQRFGIHIIASDVLGFAGAMVSFSFVVSDHVLVFSNDDDTVDAVRGIPVNITTLRSRLSLDGHPVKDVDLETVKADVPDWLGFDNQTIILHGTPPLGVTSGIANVSVIDVYGDVATAVVRIRVSPTIFLGSIGILNAAAGKQFSYTISQAVFKDPNVVVRSDVSPPTPWLAFDSENLQFEGNVPYDAVPSDINVNLTATSGSGLLSDFQVFIIKVENPNVHTASATRSSGARPTKSQTNTSQAKPSDTSDRRKKLAAAVAVPCLFLIAAIAAIIFWCRRRPEKNAWGECGRSPVISWPLERINDPWPTAEKVKSLDSGTLKRVPLLGVLSAMWKSSTDFQTSNYRQAKNQLSGCDLNSHSANLGGNIREFVRPPREVSATSELTTNFSFKTPTRPQRYSGQDERADTCSSPIRRNSRSFSHYSDGNGDSPRSVRRLSGIGHGAGGYGPPGYGVPKRSWRRTGSSRNWGTIRSSDMSAVTESTDVLLSGFPSIRVVTSPDPARVSVARSDWRSITRRRGQSPFFGGSRGASSRRSSPGSPRAWGYRPRAGISISQVNPGDPVSLFDSVLRDLSTQGTVEDYSLASIDEQSKGLETGASARFDQISQVSRFSDASSRFGSASASPHPRDFPRDESSFGELMGESGYQREGTFTDQGSFYFAGDKRGSILEYETVKLQGVAGGDNSTVSPASPRLKLVDFKGKRPVSVDVHASRRIRSDAGDMAFL